jgi:hypothetical protein
VDSTVFLLASMSACLSARRSEPEVSGIHGFNQWNAFRGRAGKVDGNIDGIVDGTDVGMPVVICMGKDVRTEIGNSDGGTFGSAVGTTVGNVVGSNGAGTFGKAVGSDVGSTDGRAVEVPSKAVSRTALLGVPSKAMSKAELMDVLLAQLSAELKAN